MKLKDQHIKLFNLIKTRGLNNSCSDLTAEEKGMLTEAEWQEFSKAYHEWNDDLESDDPYDPYLLDSEVYNFVLVLLIDAYTSNNIGDDTLLPSGLVGVDLLGTNDRIKSIFENIPKSYSPTYTTIEADGTRMTYAPFYIYTTVNTPFLHTLSGQDSHTKNVEAGIKLLADKLSQYEMVAYLSCMQIGLSVIDLNCRTLLSAVIFDRNNPEGGSLILEDELGGVV